MAEEVLRDPSLEEGRSRNISVSLQRQKQLIYFNLIYINTHVHLAKQSFEKDVYYKRVRRRYFICTASVAFRFCEIFLMPIKICQLPIYAVIVRREPVSSEKFGFSIIIPLFGTQPEAFEKKPMPLRGFVRYKFFQLSKRLVQLLLV